MNLTWFLLIFSNICTTVYMVHNYHSFVRSLIHPIIHSPFHRVYRWVSFLVGQFNHSGVETSHEVAAVINK